jgi:hypothetical protein
LNYITEKRQAPSSALRAETVLVVCATLRAKHADIFGPLKFSDGALESYIRSCRVVIFDAADSSSSVVFPHVLSEFERSVGAPFIVLQARAFVMFRPCALLLHRQLTCFSGLSFGRNGKRKIFS